jgi:hypothetical protein
MGKITLVSLIFLLLPFASASAPPSKSVRIQIDYYYTDDQGVIAHIDAIEERYFAEEEALGGGAFFRSDPRRKELDRLRRERAERIEGALATVPPVVVECIAEPPAYAKVKFKKGHLVADEIINITSADSSGVVLSKGVALPASRDPGLWSLPDPRYHEYGLHVESVVGVRAEGANVLVIELLRVAPSRETPRSNQCSVAAHR